MRWCWFKPLIVVLLAVAIVTMQLSITVSGTSATAYGTLLQTFDEITGIGSAYPNSTSVGICKADGTQTYTDALTSEAVNPLSIVTETDRGKILRFRKTPATAQYGAHVIIGNTEGVGLTGITAETYYNAIISFDYKVDIAVCAGNGTLIKQFNLAADGGYYRYNWSLWNNATKSCNKLVSVNNYASAEEPELTYSAFKLIKDNEWHTYSFAVKLGTKDGGKKLGFVIDSPANDDIDFYLDNVSLTVIDVESGTNGATVCLRSNGGAPMDLIGGIVGDPMTLPTPSKSDSVFAGWYSDAELTTPAGNVFVSNSSSFGTRENAITYYYAKWTEETHDIVTDFDNYSSVGGSTDAYIGTNKPTYADFNSTTRTGVEILDLDDGIHGKVLHLSKKTSAEKYQPTVIIGNGSGQGISTTVSETCNVLVRFKYIVNESNSNSFYINRFHLTNQAQWPSSTGLGGFAGKSSYLSAETPEDYGSYKLICDNTWREVAVVIWNVPAHATVANGLSRIGFTFDIGKTAQCDLYIDDFSATRLSSGAAYSNICIHPDNGGVFDLTTAPVGSAGSLPTLTKKEKEFGGWFLDSGLTTPLGSTIPAATDNWNSSGTLKVLNVYAKWQELSNTIIANFDSLSSVGGAYDSYLGTNTPTYTDSNSETQTGIEIANLSDGVHGNVLHLSKQVSASKYQPTVIVGNASGDGIDTVKDDTCDLLLKFDYKINSSNINSFFINRFHLTNQAKWPSSTGSGGFAGKSTYLSAETPDDYGSYKLICDNSWHSVKIVIYDVPAHANISDKSAKLGFTFDTGKTAQCDLYLDNFKVTRLSAGSEYSNICIHSNNGKSYDFLADEVGSAAELPSVTKKGCFFCGWYLDPLFTNEATETVATATDDWNSSGTLKVLNYYAKWVLKYDVNDDGTAANASDIVSLINSLLGKNVDIGNFCALTADCNKDGSINIIDLVCLKKHAASVIYVSSIGQYLPSALTVTMYDTSTNTYGFTWNTDTRSDTSVLQICVGNEFNPQSCSEYVPSITEETTYTNTDIYGDYIDEETDTYYIYRANVQLTSGAIYSYRVYDSAADIGTADYQFTARNTSAQKFTFAHISDSQVDAPDAYIKDNSTAIPFNNTLNGIFESDEDIDFLVHTGDFVEYSKYEDFWRTMIDYNDDYLATTPIMAISGNHETSYRNGKNETYKHFSYNVPEQNTQKGIFYYFDYGNARFIMLNTNRLTNNRLTDDQYNWLVSVFEDNPQKWTIVSLHNPIYSVGTWGSSPDRNYICLALRNQLADLFATYGVDLVLQGHDHTYSKTYPIGIGGIADTDYTYQTIDSVKYAVDPDGVIYAMNGPAGNQTRTPVSTDGATYELYGASNVSSWAEITIDGDMLTVTVKYYNNGTAQVWNSYGIIKNAD